MSYRNVYLKPPEAESLVRKVLAGDVAGKCYAASEAAYHLAGGKAAGLTPMVLRCADGPYRTHWFLHCSPLDGPSYTLDPTAAQFTSVPPYHRARGCGFLTKRPSRAAQRIIDAVLARLSLQDCQPGENATLAPPKAPVQ
jgi:hypothetical protein